MIIRVDGKILNFDNITVVAVDERWSDRVRFDFVLHTYESGVTVQFGNAEVASDFLESMYEAYQTGQRVFDY